jgi:hypothetical protein
MGLSGSELIRALAGAYADAVRVLPRCGEKFADPDYYTRCITHTASLWRLSNGIVIAGALMCAGRRHRPWH